MADAHEVIYRHPRKFRFMPLVGFGMAGASFAALRLGDWADRGNAFWEAVGGSCALVGFVGLHALSARVSADAFGLRSRTLFRRWSVAWHEVADVREYLQYTRSGSISRISVELRDGRKRRLTLPLSSSKKDRPDFDANLGALRELNRRYGTPESSHLPVVTNWTVGRSLTQAQTGGRPRRSRWSALPSRACDVPGGDGDNVPRTWHIADIDDAGKPVRLAAGGPGPNHPRAE